MDGFITISTESGASWGCMMTVECVKIDPLFLWSYVMPDKRPPKTQEAKGDPLYIKVFEIYFKNGCNGADAYRRGGGTGKNASLGFNNLLRSEEAFNHFRELKAKYTADIEGRQTRLRERVTDIADVDPSEYADIWRGACRCCHGDDHKYQYRPAEWRKVMTEYANACSLAEHLGKNMPGFPDPEGGVGFNKNKDPHPECPECDGNGHVYERIKPTSEWSPAARKAFAGVKRTKDGIEIKLLDVQKAQDLLAKMDNMLEKHQEAGSGELHVHFDEKDGQA